jgi:hypothetical protein
LNNKIITDYHYYARLPKIENSNAVKSGYFVESQKRLQHPGVEVLGQLGLGE